MTLFMIETSSLDGNPAARLEQSVNQMSNTCFDNCKAGLQHDNIRTRVKLSCCKSPAKIIRFRLPRSLPQNAATILRWISQSALDFLTKMLVIDRLPHITFSCPSFSPFIWEDFWTSLITCVSQEALSIRYFTTLWTMGRPLEALPHCWEWGFYDMYLCVYYKSNTVRQKVAVDPD